MMNCIKKAFSYLIPCILFSLALAQEPLSTTSDTVQECARTIEQLETLIPRVIDVLHELYMYEDYWKMQQLTPLAYFLSKDPTKWIYRKQEWQKVDSCLAFIKQEQEHHAYYLGLFTQYLKEKTSNLLAEPQHMKILETIEHFLSHYPHHARLYDGNTKIETIKQRVDRNEYLLTYYKKNARKAFAHCAEPNHFQRNWLGYSFGALALASAGYFIYKNKANLESWIHTGVEGMKKYCHEHVSNPIVNALKSIFDKNRDPLVVKEGVTARKNALEGAIRNHYAIFLPDINQEQINNVVKDALDGNLDEFLKRENILWEKVFNSANFFVKIFTQQELVRELISCLHINKQSALLQKDVGALDIENLKNAQALNIELIAVLPSALLGYFSYFIGKKLFNKIVLQKTTYQPLRKALRKLQVILNNYTATNENLSVADQGFVYYWINQFKKHSTLISLNERKMILEDLQELESTHFTPTQKMNVISRMYYNYSFLLPNGK